MNNETQLKFLKERLAYLKECNRFDANHETEFSMYVLGGNPAPKWEIDFVRQMKEISIIAHEKQIMALENPDKEYYKFTQDGVADDKYFRFDGKVTAKCPKCGNELTKDFSDDHLEYVEDEYLNKENTIGFHCTPCDTYLEKVIVVKRLSYSIEMEVSSQAKEVE